MGVLTAIDVLGIQRFVFASNRLRDVVGGSSLVEWATADPGALQGLGGRLLTCGGGNAMLEFDGLEEARAFAARFSRRIFDNAPGLELAIEHREFAPGGLGEAIRAIQVQIARRKMERVPHAPLLGLGVTERCRETGLPAVVGDEDRPPAEPLSAGIQAARHRFGSRDVRARWNPFVRPDRLDPSLQDLARNGCAIEFEFPGDLDRLGRSRGDTSQVAVVHVDGNGVGQKIRGWLSNRIESRRDDEVIRAEYREWSGAIDDLGRRALQAVVDRVLGSLRPVMVDGVLQGFRVVGKVSDLSFSLHATRHGDLPTGQAHWTLSLPIRPILLGGDDLTFACDGRLALSLAAEALSVFQDATVPHLGALRAAAGVAFARSHQPILQSAHLAERLCRSAKAMLRAEMKSDSECALDWHVGRIRPGEPVEEIRRREYRVGTNSLTARPCRLGSAGDAPWTWMGLESALLLPDVPGSLRGPGWAERRNKAKDLAELVVRGPDALKDAMESWSAIDGRVALPKALGPTGFQGGRTPVLDAVELLDLHLPL